VAKRAERALRAKRWLDAALAARKAMRLPGFGGHGRGLISLSSLLFSPPIYGAYCSVTGSEASGGGSAAAVSFAVCCQAVATAWGSSFPLG
jgi:hypothetical protein